MTDEEIQTNQEIGCGCFPLVFAVLSAGFFVLGLVAVLLGEWGGISGFGAVLVLLSLPLAALSVPLALIVFLLGALPLRATQVALLIGIGTLVLATVSFATGLLELSWFTA